MTPHQHFQFSLFGDDLAVCDSEPSVAEVRTPHDLFEAAPKKRTAVSKPTHSPKAPASRKRKAEPYEGWSNSATYLADLYISNCASTCSRVFDLLNQRGTIDPHALASLFEVRFATEQESDEDDYEAGLIGGNTLVLDYWAEGSINFNELAQSFAHEAKMKRGTDAVELHVLQALSQATVADCKVILNSGQLSRDTYGRLDRILKAMGGSWDRKSRSHVFGFDPTAAIDELLQTGHLVRPENFDAFFTPPKLAKQVIELAQLEPGMRLLEPSAGEGALLLPAAEIVGIENCVGVEIQPSLAESLRSRGYQVHTGNFLSQPCWGSNALLYDRVVANPPFSKQLDIDFVMHAWSMLARSGRLVSIMAASVAFRNDAKTSAFRDFVRSVGGSIEPNPEGAFKSVGTAVRTVTVVMNKSNKFVCVSL